MRDVSLVNGQNGGGFSVDEDTGPGWVRSGRRQTAYRKHLKSSTKLSQKLDGICFAMLVARPSLRPSAHSFKFGPAGGRRPGAHRPSLQAASAAADGPLTAVSGTEDESTTACTVASRSNPCGCVPPGRGLSR